MTATLVPIFCGCILPIAIVLIVSMRKKNNDDKRAEILIKAIESGEEVDAEKLADALGKPKNTPLEVLNARLLRGCLYTLVGLALIIINQLVTRDQDLEIMLYLCGGISFAVGIAYLIVYFVTRKQVIDEKKS